MGAPLERVLPAIAEKVLSGGARLLVVAQEPLLGLLDEQLWSYAKDSFLPHGRSGEAGAERQPILLSPQSAPENGATHVALADGHWRDQALEFERSFFFFDHAAIDEARRAWRSLKKQGAAELHYWKRDDRGKWVEGP